MTATRKTLSVAAAGAVVATTALLLAPSAVVKPDRNVLAFVYPPGATNYFWDVERSTDLVHWAAIVRNCHGEPSTNGDVSVKAGGTNGPKSFYRLRGHRNYEL